jgi:uncharacterized protein (TIGR02996 family)
MDRPKTLALPDELMGLLVAVRDNPADEGTRLVMADWLEEYGTPADHARAELIRVQCRQHRIGPDVPEHYGGGITAADARLLRMQLDREVWKAEQRERDSLDQRVRQLWGEHGEDWLGPLFPRVRFPRDARSERGLVHLKPAAAKFFSKPFQAATAALAWVSALELRRCQEKMVPLLTCLVNMPSLCSLKLFDPVGSYDSGRALAACLGMSFVRSLSLPHVALSLAGLWDLARSPHLGGLRRLCLYSVQLGDEAVEAVLAGQWRLERLDLSNTRTTKAGAKLLAGSPAAAGLTSLDLMDNDLGDEGVAALAASPHLANLVSLNLYRTGMTDAGAAALAESPHLNKLRWLSVRYNNITTPGAERLRRRLGVGLRTWAGG